MTAQVKNGLQIVKALEAARQAANMGRVEVELHNPSRHVRDTLAANSITIEKEEFHRWCFSGNTCAHNSHDEGTQVVTVAVPSDWCLEPMELADSGVDIAKVFEDFSEQDTPLFILPEATPKVVVSRDYGSPWAPGTLILASRNHLK